MRYEDASGSFQASGPIANDDSDTLPAGSRQAATGNLITGEGTQYGSAGADSAAGGHITSIAGKGGEDSSFAGGKLSVAGEHGNLSVDAEGNYNYMANKGAPENVRDRFTYTLADNQGNSDTAALVIELGKTPVVIKADAQQIVPGPDGVVTLPPGVDLSDVMVVGRNLVINMPDGTQLIIIDGAVFVPQLVFDGVQVPATNVAALLIGQEPQPAAGELPPSSGGNFALPPPPLDPGVPLGDLIPPTVRDYIPPEPQETFLPLDDEPEVGPNPDVLRDDDALQGGNAGGVGDDPDAVNVTGQLSGSGGDGDLTFDVLLTGAPTGFTYESGGDGIVLIKQGGVTVLTVTVESDGSYSVIQNAPIDHTGVNEDNVLFTIGYTVTDEDGDSAGGSFTINVDDDTPLLTELVAQGGVTLDETTAGSPAGFPISSNSLLPIIDFNALFGADGAAAVDSTAVGLVINGGGSSGLQTAVGNFAITLVQIDADTIEGHYNGSNVAFIVQLEADGTITLTQNVPLEHVVDGPPGPAHDDPIDLGGLLSVSVTITDGDGDEATGQVGIGDLLVFRDDGPDAHLDPEAQLDTVVLDETRPEGTDTDDGSPVATPPDGLKSATIDFADNFGTPDFGADGAGTVTYQLVLSANGIGSGLYALQGGDTSDSDGDGYGQGAEILLSQSGNTITGAVGGTTYFTIAIDPATGEVTFTQLNPIWHPTPGDWDEIATLTTELASDIQVQQTVTDSDGDFDTETVDIGHDVFSIQDDGPDPFEECPDDVITVNEVGSTFTGDLNLPDVGEDEPGAVTFGVQDGDPVLSGGNPVVSNGVALFYFINDAGVLEARVGDETGEVIFTVTINGDGTFTYDQFGTIGNSGQISFEDLTSTSAGNVEFRGVGADDAATTVDILLSGSDAGADATVNTDSDSIGTANQSMDSGETVRIDLVSNLTSGAGTPSGFGYGAHVSTTSFEGLIPQVQGNQDETVAFTVWALDSSNTQGTEPDRNPAGGFSDATITDITEVTVTDFQSGLSTTAAVSYTDGTTFVNIAYGISVRVNADGSVTFAGIQEGDSYGFTTGTGDFNAVVVQAEPAGTGGSTEDSFDLGVFSIGVDEVIDPVDLAIPIVLTDADGDPVVCDLDIHIGPPVSVEDITITVNEAGLDVIGSDAGSNSETQGGDLQGQVAGGTGPYTFAFAAGEDGNGAYGTLTLNPDGTFSYTLETPLDSQPDADDGTNLEMGVESFQVVATDSLGATQTLTINVNVIDDVPTAVDDTDEVVEGGSTSGNVITGDGGDGDPAGEDIPGADGLATDAVVGVVTGDDDSVDTDDPTTVGVQIAGTYGTLTLNEDGSYDYDADPNTNPPPGAVDEFVYTIMDNDGDLHSAVLTISVIDDLVPDVPENTIVGLDDDALTGGNPNGTGDDPDSVNTSGSVAATGGDGTITYALSESGAPVGFTYDLQGNGDLWILQGATHVLTVTLDASGNYTVSQVNPIDHPAGSDENNQPFTVTFRATDEDGDWDEGTLSISVDDDTPIANDDTDTIASGSLGPATGNVITGVGTVEGAANADSDGADGGGAVVGVAAGDTNTNLNNPATVGVVISGAYGDLTLNSDGSYSYARDAGSPGGVEDVFTYTFIDGDGDLVNATLTIEIGNSTPDVPENVNVGLDDDALTGGNPNGTGDDPNAVNTSGSVAAVGGDGTITYALSETGAPAGFTYDLQGNGDLWVLQGTTHVLTVTLDASGNYTVSQVNPIVHPAGSDENNQAFTVTFRATDADGEFDEGTLSISVDDDTPINFTPVPLTDTPPLVAPTQDDALVNDGSANVIRLLNDANNDGTGENFIGADGFGSLYFTGTPADDGQALEDTGGTPLTSGSDPIYLFGFGTDTLYGSTDPAFDPNSPTGLVFTIELSEGTGYGSNSTYEVTFVQPIDDGSGFVFDDFSTAPAGQNDWIGLDADGLDINDPLDPNANSEDLLLTPTNVGGSVNTSATDIGNANQWIDDGEGIRLDYVVDVRRDPGSDEKDAAGYAFDGHYNVTDSSFTIMQTQGGGDAAVRITAFNDPDSGNLDTLSGSIVAIDPASIVVTGDATYTVTALADGSVVITGLAAGASIEFEAVGDVFFNSYSVTNANGVLNTATPAPADTFSGAPFAIGVFGFNSETAGSPVDLAFDVTAEDADGDTSTGTIDITLVPADSSTLTTLAATSESSGDTLSFSSLAYESQSEQLQKTAANSNTLTLAAAIAGAGLADSVAANSGIGDLDRGNGHKFAVASDSHVQQFSVADDGGNAAVSTLVADSSTDASDLADSSSSSSSDNVSADNSLDDSSAQAAPEPSDLPAADDGGADSSADAASPVAPTVAMVSAEALEAAANDNGDAQQGGSVEQIVADALHQGNAPDLDAALANLPGGNGALQALAHMASPDAAAVSSWDMGGHGAIGAGFDMMFKMDVATHHQDAAQPIANG